MKEFQILYSYENSVILKLFEHKNKEVEIGEIRIPYNSWVRKNNWLFYDIGKKGKIHLFLQWIWMDSLTDISNYIC